MNGVGMSSKGSFVKKSCQMDQKLESTACDLKHVFISVSKGNYPDVRSGDTITIPVTVKFSVSHRRQKHLAVYIVSNEMWKVNWE